jgi:hypothetical protein
LCDDEQAISITIQDDFFRRFAKSELGIHGDFLREIPAPNGGFYEHDLQQDTSVQYSINPYLKHDPTLPVFTTMVCPNGLCPSREMKESHIVGIKLDPVNVSWLYQCIDCDTTWKQLARG